MRWHDLDEDRLPGPHYKKFLFLVGLQLHCNQRVFFNACPKGHLAQCTLPIWAVFGPTPIGTPAVAWPGEPHNLNPSITVTSAGYSPKQGSPLGAGP